MPYRLAIPHKQHNLFYRNQLYLSTLFLKFFQKVFLNCDNLTCTTALKSYLSNQDKMYSIIIEALWQYFFETFFNFFRILDICKKKKSSITLLFSFFVNNESYFSTLSWYRIDNLSYRCNGTTFFTDNTTDVLCIQIQMIF